MKNIYLLYVVFFIHLTVNAQENLFPNPSFEEYTQCFDGKTKESKTLVNYWGRPINQDTFSSNPCDTSWVSYLNALESRSGLAAQYFLAWYNDPRTPNDESRSYLVVPLKKTLVEGNYYYFKMYVKCIYNNLQNFGFSNGQAVAFSRNVPKPPGNDAPLKLVPAIQFEKLADTNWTRISGCFVAKGGERYAIIGNFKTQNETKTHRLKELSNPVISNIPGLNLDLSNKSLTVSYLVDDVELLPLNADYPKDTAICEGESLVLNVKNNLHATYKWQDGTTSPQYAVTKSGSYKVEINYIVDGVGCKVEQVIKVNVLPKFAAKALVDTVICNFKTILLKTGRGRRDDTIVWQDNSMHDTFRVSRSGTYGVQITNSCGKYLESYKVDFVNCTIDVYVPNAFSPNGDNINDTFAPFVHAVFPITEYEFAVFNRWGNRIFFTTDLNRAWDGTFQNKGVETGVYIWYCVTRGLVGTKKILKEESGDVTLIR